ncbi:helix-turn-helix domain-containing protein [Candidatus Vampirococcus lugosii]|uniref:Transposase, containing Winged HTH domain n=2 Tax=Candidatus Vampirococcus lugosii TaxID=2789015 RepID=A0ABS5QPU3_9BACT|nr:helix-turn-helix domain-containing protein [Candidatus Vampirococcus lugosii]MBS8122526.1 putative transposase, containing Winged HTH domain [Candidatus Vampirococcus lugosii]
MIEKIKEIELREKTEKSGKSLKRLQCLRFRLEGIKYKQIQKLLNISEDTIARWVKKYNNGGIEGLLSTKNNGKPSKLSEKEIAIIKEENEKKGFNTAEDAQKYIEKKFGIKYCISNVRNILKKN